MLIQQKIMIEDFPQIKTTLYFYLDIESYVVEVEGINVLYSKKLIEVSDYINTLIQDYEYQEVHNE